MTTVRQFSFAGGEIAPALYGRVDAVKYATGLRTCRNFICMRHGGVANRPGTAFVAEVKDSTKTVKLIPFIFNADQTYVLEFGNLYMRVHRNGAQVVETSATITNITQANPAVVTTSAAHGYATGNEVFISGVGGMTQVNNRNFKITFLTGTTFSLQLMDGTTNLDSTGFGAYTSGGTSARVFEIVTPYLEADLQDLQIAQSADVITIVHLNHDPRELSRTAHTAWTLAVISFVPSVSAPTVPSASNGTAGAIVWRYKVTTVKTETYEESLPTASFSTTGGLPTTTNPNTLTWTAATNALGYNVYRETVPGSGSYGFIGTADGTAFADDFIKPDASDTPPISRSVLTGANNRPSTVNYFQQRIIYANTNNDPETVFTSRSAAFKNFTISNPLQDDDAVTFTLSGRQVNSIKHLLDLGRLIILTTGGEWTVEGDQAGILTPTDINPRQHSYNGSGNLPPIIASGNALYIQSRGTIVRDLGFDYTIDGYRGNDLTIFSAHLFEGFTIRDWTYQQNPHSIIWAVRSNGTLLGFTYVREHELRAWHRHDFDGTAEQVAAVPEGIEDSLYIVVKRTVNAKTVRYIERMASRRVGDIKDSVFVDSKLSHDGRNTNTAHTMTLSGGTLWTSTETLTLTSSAAFFTAGDVNNAIQLTGSDGTLIRFTIDAFTSTTVVTGKAHKTVPVAMRSVAISSWTRALKTVTGLWHLEAKNVSIFSDGFVSANPNNAAYTIKTVANGSVTLDTPGGVIHIGLPITSDIETLDIDTAQGETLADKKKLITKVTLFVESSRGVWIGARPPASDTTDPLEGLTELKIRSNENYDEPVDLQTGTVDVNIRSEWNSNGRIFVRQVDPVPLAILAAAASGLVPFR